MTMMTNHGHGHFFNFMLLFVLDQFDQRTFEITFMSTEESFPLKNFRTNMLIF